MELKKKDKGDFGIMGKVSYFKWNIIDGVTSDSASDFLGTCAAKKYTNGFAVYIYILERMFSHGEYWEVLDDKAKKAIMRNCYVNSLNMLNSIIKTAVDAELFDKSIYEKNDGVLTSRMIQELYQVTMPACKVPFAPVVPTYMLVPYDEKNQTWLRVRGKNEPQSPTSGSQPQANYNGMDGVPF